MSVTADATTIVVAAPTGTSTVAASSAAASSAAASSATASASSVTASSVTAPSKNIAELQIHITPELSTTVNKVRYVVGDLRKVLPKQVVSTTGLKTKEKTIMSRMIGPIVFPYKNLCTVYRVTLNGKVSTTMNLLDTGVMRWWNTMCGDRLVKGLGPYISLAGLKKTDVIEMETQMSNTQDMHLGSDGKLHGTIGLECLQPVPTMPVRITMRKGDMGKPGVDVSAQIDLKHLRTMCSEVEYMRLQVAPALDSATESTLTFRPSAMATDSKLRDRMMIFLPIVMQVPTYAQVGDFLGQRVVTYVRECSRAETRTPKEDKNKVVDTTVPVETSTYADNMLVSCTCITSGTESGRSILYKNIQKHVMPTKDDLVLIIPNYRIDKDMLGALRRLQAANVVSRNFSTPLLEAREGLMLCIDWMSESMVPPLSVVKQLLVHTAGAFETDTMQGRIHANMTATLERIMAVDSKHLILKPKLEMMMIPVEGVCGGMKDVTSKEERELFKVSHMEQSEALLMHVSRGHLPEKTFLGLFKEWVMTTPAMLKAAVCLPDLAAFGAPEDTPFVGEQTLVPVTDIERKPASDVPASAVQALTDVIRSFQGLHRRNLSDITAKIAQLAHTIFQMDSVRAPITMMLEHSDSEDKPDMTVGVNTPFVLAVLDGPTCIAQLGVPLHTGTKLQWDMTDVRTLAAHNLAQVMRGGCVDIEFVGRHPVFRDATWTKTVKGKTRWMLGHRTAIHARVDPRDVQSLTSIRMPWIPMGSDDVSLNMPLVNSDATGLVSSALTSTHPMSWVLDQLPSSSTRAVLQVESFVCVPQTEDSEVAKSEYARLFQWITSWQDADVREEVARQAKAAASEAGVARETAVGTLAHRAARTPSPDVSLDRTLAAGSGFVGDTAQAAVAAAMSSSFKPPHAPKKGGATSKTKTPASPSALSAQTVHSMAHAARTASKTPSPLLMGMSGDMDAVKPLCLPGMTPHVPTRADAATN